MIPFSEKSNGLDCPKCGEYKSIRHLKYVKNLWGKEWLAVYCAECRCDFKMECKDAHQLKDFRNAQNWPGPDWPGPGDEDQKVEKEQKIEITRSQYIEAVNFVLRHHHGYFSAEFAAAFMEKLGFK